MVWEAGTGHIFLTVVVITCRMNRKRNLVAQNPYETESPHGIGVLPCLMVHGHP